MRATCSAAGGWSFCRSSASSVPFGLRIRAPHIAGTYTPSFTFIPVDMDGLENSFHKSNVDVIVIATAADFDPARTVFRPDYRGVTTSIMASHTYTLIVVPKDKYGNEISASGINNWGCHIVDSVNVTRAFDVSYDFSYRYGDRQGSYITSNTFAHRNGSHSILAMVGLQGTVNLNMPYVSNTS